MTDFLTRLTRKLRILLWVGRLAARNRMTRQSIVSAENDVIVSLTTYALRIATVYLTIESIAAGNELPGRIILWLDDVELYRNPPDTLRRLLKRGLEIKLCDNYGPHTKYYGFLASQEPITNPLVVADDDSLYHKGWLRDLLLAYRQFPEMVNCFLAKRLVLKEGKIAPYAEWKLCEDTQPSLENVAHGVAGVIYPPFLLKAIQQSGTAFLSCCPKADDIWLHLHALRNGVPTRQVKPTSVRPTFVPGTQDVGLWHQNYQGGNDDQIAKTYTAQDLVLLKGRISS